MTTLRQAEANRRNAEKSTGPKTEAGKKISSRNAMTHGLSSYAMLPDDMEAAKNEEIALFKVIYPPKDDLDLFYIDQAAMSSVRIRQALITEQILVCHEVREAEEDWDEARTVEATALLNKLGKKPNIVALELEKTTQGCRLMIERWELLRRRLESGKPWDEAQRAMALDLKGYPSEFRDLGHEDLATIDAQRTLATAQIERLKRRQTEKLDRFDTEDRDAARRGLAIPGKEIWRIRRYEMQARVHFDRAMRFLAHRYPTATRKPAATPQPKPEPKFVPEPMFIPEPKPRPISPPEEVPAPFKSRLVELRAKELDALEAVERLEREQAAAKKTASSARPERKLNRKQRRAMAQRELARAS